MPDPSLSAQSVSQTQMESAGLKGREVAGRLRAVEDGAGLPPSTLAGRPKGFASPGLHAHSFHTVHPFLSTCLFCGIMT